MRGVALVAPALLVALAPTALGISTDELGMPYAESFGLPMGDIRTIVLRFVRTLMGLIGIVMVLQIMWSGFKYMTHGGNEEARDEAIAGIKNAVIGLCIVMMSVAAANFVITAVLQATGNVF